MFKLFTNSFQKEKEFFCEKYLLESDLSSNNIGEALDKYLDKIKTIKITDKNNYDFTDFI